MPLSRPSITDPPAEAELHPETVLHHLQTLADPTRVRLMCVLMEAELPVGALCEVLELPQSTISRHLKTLGEQGWVLRERRATSRCYRVDINALTARQCELWELTRRQADGWATLDQDRVRLRHHQASRPASPRAFFASVAHRWTQTRAATYGDALNGWLLAAAAHPDEHVVDFGCGTGALVRDLAPVVTSVVGLDSSPEMLAAALEHAPPSNVRFEEADLASSGLPTGSATLALCSLSLTYVPDPAAVVREAARVLKAGGRLVLLDLLRHNDAAFQRVMQHRHPGFDPAALRGDLVDAGLTPGAIGHHRVVGHDPDAPRAPALFTLTGRKQAPQAAA